MNVQNRTLFIADNLDIMRGMDSETIDLIYLDPPFNTNKEHKAFAGEFKDIWTDEDVKLEWHGEIAYQHQDLYQVIQASETLYDKSMKIYLTAMAIRLFEMKRLLKRTGSIYLHCDPTASHYLKLVMDELFGKNNFRAEIVWKRHNAHNDKLFGQIHETIFFYSLGDKSIPDDVRIPLSKKRLKNFRHVDSRGKYSVGDLTGSETRNGESGQPWRDFDPTSRYRHWAVPRTGKYAEYIETNFIPNYRSIKSIHERLDILEKNRLIYWNKEGTPQLKRYLMPDAGQPPQSLWTDIPPVKKPEKEGYPTQKPLKLLERIIKASSNAGEFILDPFCGCATACVAAETLYRQWIGIDISSKAGEITKKRLKKVSRQGNVIVHLSDVTVTDAVPKRTDLHKTETQIIMEEIFHPKDYKEYSQTELQSSLTDKQLLYGHQEGKCNGCLYPLPFRNITIDHIIPKAETGGVYDERIENKQLLCGTCNSTKGKRLQSEFIDQLIREGRRYG